MGGEPLNFGKLRLAVIGLAVMGAMMACSPIERFYGFVPPAAEVASLEIGVTTKEEAIALGFVDEETFDAVVRPEQMIGPKD